MKRLILTALAAVTFGGLGVAYAVGTAFDKESDANTNLTFAHITSRDVLRQVKTMPKRMAKDELAWLAECQARTTRDCILRTGGL